VSYDTQTTDAGLYVLPDLPVGTYLVSIGATGFKSAKIENLVVTVGQTVTQNVTLEAGAPTESITVTASGEQLVQSSEASLSTLLNRKVWESYPLENRDSNEFIDLLPGAVSDAIAGTTRGAAVNGARPGMGSSWWTASTTTTRPGRARIHRCWWHHQYFMEAIQVSHHY
jgi:hypothetical protein